MSYFSSFMFSPMKPVEAWKEHTQEFLNEEFENSSNIAVIEEEIEFGSLNFRTIKARVITTLDSKVGDKINDDYRTLFFPILDYVPKLGQRYRFDNNIWIVYNTDNIKSLNSSCYVRRCNNTINTLDYYGNVHREPCVIDLKPTKSSFVEDESMWTVSTRQIIMYQFNKWTENITYNTRIMYEDQVYRIGVNLDFNRLETFNEKSVSFIRAYLDLDLINDYDNKELRIADYHKPDFNIDLGEPFDLLVGATGKFNYSIKRDNEPVPRSAKVIWATSNSSVLKVNKATGEYEALTKGWAKITARLQQNLDYFSSMIINVEDTIKDKYSISISPTDYYIPLNQTKTYEVFEFKNGIQQPTTFTFKVSGLSNKYYTKTVTDNSISIKNKKQNTSVLLSVEIINNRTEEIVDTLYLELGGLF